MRDTRILFDNLITLFLSKCLVLLPTSVFIWGSFKLASFIMLFEMLLSWLMFIFRRVVLIKTRRIIGALYWCICLSCYTLFIIEIPKQLPIAFVVVKRNTLSEAVQDVIFYLTIQWVFRLIKRHSSYKDTDHWGLYVYNLSYFQRNIAR